MQNNITTISVESVTEITENLISSLDKNFDER